MFTNTQTNYYKNTIRRLLIHKYRWWENNVDRQRHQQLAGSRCNQPQSFVGFRVVQIHFEFQTNTFYHWGKKVAVWKEKNVTSSNLNNQFTNWFISILIFQMGSRSILPLSSPRGAFWARPPSPVWKFPFSNLNGKSRGLKIKCKFKCIYTHPSPTCLMSMT